MAARVFAAVVLILLGSVLAVPIAILLGTVALGSGIAMLDSA